LSEDDVIGSLSKDRPDKLIIASLSLPPKRTLPIKGDEPPLPALAQPVLSAGV